MTDKVKNCYAFTLIELMVVISIFGVLIAVAVPSFNNMTVRHQLGGGARDIMAVMRQARTAAVKENTDIVVAFNTANNSYTVFVDDGAGSVDANSDGILDNALNWVCDGNERQLALGQLPKNVNMTAANFSGNPAFRFDRRGFPNDAANMLTGGMVTLADIQGGAVRNVVLLLSGHTSIQ
ncbi:MAG: GspH/FimT family pseudopilin [Desulfobacterales bacterium]|jgi:prepilin-type N-terminal cleavage/methylation domain-containing protein|nr:GspH/FimT family pseudopilin [Desulfobacterales bacterium]